MGAPVLQFVAVTSVRPPQVTEPRQVRRVTASMHSGRFGGCYHVVMYYENMKEYGNDGDHHAWVMAGWMVESLTEALSEYPLLAGRLKRKDEEGGEIIMEIVSNDSGIRMVEAKISISLSHLLEGGEKDNLEHELVFWRDIDEKYPEFSPLFYVQITKFECGGYSIGISCSMLVADYLIVDNFLKKWADIHKNQSPRCGEIETPIFYHPRLQYPTFLSTYITSRTPYKNGGQNLLFKITAEEDSVFESELARLCILKEAKKNLPKNLGSEVCFFVKKSSEIIMMETCLEGEQDGQVLGLKNQMRSTTWDEIGDYDVDFEEGHMPLHVSRWIGSAYDMKFLAVTYPKDGSPVAILVSSHI